MIIDAITRGLKRAGRAVVRAVRRFLFYTWEERRQMRAIERRLRPRLKDPDFAARLAAGVKDRATKKLEKYETVEKAPEAAQ